MRSIHNLSINTDALKDINCQYIFSSVIIENAQSISLKLLESFDHKEAPYTIHLYAVE